MDRYEVCRLLEDAIANGCPSEPIDYVLADGASLVVETLTGERFRLDVTLEGRVGEP